MSSFRTGSQVRASRFLAPARTLRTDAPFLGSAVDNLLASPDGTKAALQEIQALKRSLTDATPFLPAYDQRRYQDVRIYLEPSHR